MEPITPPSHARPIALIGVITAVAVICAVWYVMARDSGPSGPPPLTPENIQKALDAGTASPEPVIPQEEIDRAVEKLSAPVTN